MRHRRSGYSDKASALIDRLARLIGDQPAGVPRVAVHGPDTAGRTRSDTCRYLRAKQLYRADTAPDVSADVVIDNTDPAFPRTEMAGVRQIGSLQSLRPRRRCHRLGLVRPGRGGLGFAHKTDVVRPPWPGPLPPQPVPAACSLTLVPTAPAPSTPAGTHISKHSGQAARLRLLQGTLAIGSELRAN